MLHSGLKENGVRILEIFAAARHMRARNPSATDAKKPGVAAGPSRDHSKGDQ
jgi:hypothetical protein